MGKFLVLLLSFFLMAWEAANFGAELINSMGTIGMRGVSGGVELALHGLVTIIAVAAGWSLRSGAPHAPSLAQLALAASAARSVQSLYWSVLPHQTVPVDRLPMAVAAVVHAVTWIAYLRRSEYVRASYS